MEYAIQVHGLCKNYKDFSLQNVTLNVPTGSIVGFVGENGAGKTTTLKAILGAVRIDGGAVVDKASVEDIMQFYAGRETK